MNDLIAITPGTTAAIFMLAAAYAIRQPRLARVLDRYAQWVAPFILISVGIYIFANTATDLLAD